MNVKEMYAITPDKNGWRKLPSGIYVKLGNNVTLGDYVTLGDDVKLGNNVTLGDYVTLGDDVKLGNNVTLGNNVKLGDGVTLGDDVTLGNNVKLGNNVTSDQLAEIYRKNYISIAFEHIFIKWVTPSRMSPGWGNSRPIEYKKGSVVEADGEKNDQQCGPGLHVFRLGERPEWHGLCAAEHNYIPLRVKVRSEDILFAGLPTNDAKIRVRRLEVLD